MAHSGTLNMAQVDRMFLEKIKEARLRREKRIYHVKTREALIEDVESIKTEIEKAFDANW